MFSNRQTYRFFVIALIGVIHSKQLPSYFKRCSRNDPNFFDCVVKNGNLAIPQLVQGDPEYGLPVMNPFRIPELTYKTKDLELKLKNLDIYGLEKTDLKAVSGDFKSLHEGMKLSIPSLKMKGEYEIKGQILVLPITGNGPISLDVTNIDVTYQSTFKLEEREGKIYRITTDSELKYTPEKITFKLENLFADKALSDQMNQVLNENWKDVNKELEGVITESINNLIKTISKGITNNVPYEDMFLP